MTCPKATWVDHSVPDRPTPDAELVLESNRALAREEAGETDVIREPLKIAAG